MARTAAILIGVVGGLYWSGIVEFDHDHVKWFCVPFTAYVVGMFMLYS
jgi:hypothetical protein